MRLADGRYLPVERATMHATTGSGPGGQHRNRSHTRVELRLPLAMMGLTPAELDRIRNLLHQRIIDDALVVRAGEQRSQPQSTFASTGCPRQIMHITRVKGGLWTRERDRRPGRGAHALTNSEAISAP